VSNPKPIRVLVADHDRWTRFSITNVLRETGFGIHEASNGMSALRMAAEASPQIVLIGQQLPEISVVEVVRTLRADRRTRHAAVVQCQTDRQASLITPGVDVDGRLHLPCSPIDLLATLVNALEARRSEVGRVRARVDRAAVASERRRTGVAAAHRARTRGKYLAASVDRPD
jgi:CheY-like chemotaxis protein